jgi:AraC-like DNA-binding protein
MSMGGSDITIEILKDIRDEIRNSNQHLALVESTLTQRLGAVESTLTQHLGAVESTLTQRLGAVEPRLSSLEIRVDKLESGK